MLTLHQPLTSDTKSLENGRRAAVLLGVDDFDALIETVEILGDSALLADVRAGLAEFEAGDSVGAEEVATEMRNAGR